MRIINEEIFFNAVLEDMNYNIDNTPLSLFMNIIIIPLLSIILSFIINFFIGTLTDCKDDLRDLFIYEEKQMIKDENYKVKDKRKKEMKMAINDILTQLKKKIIIFFIIDLLIWIFCFYYVVLYCIIFSFRQIRFIIKSIISIIQAILSNFFLSLILTIFYEISLKCKRKRLFSIISFFM